MYIIMKSYLCSLHHNYDQFYHIQHSQIAVNLDSMLTVELLSSCSWHNIDCVATVSRDVQNSDN